VTTTCMILAAGQGKRLRPITNTIPKALVPVAGKPLILHHLEKLAAAGMRRVVINVAYLGDQIIEVVNQANIPGLTVVFSPEPPGGYETAGGIVCALPLLGERPFAVINADVWSDYPYEQLKRSIDGYAHLIVVANPAHHVTGDFNLQGAWLYRDTRAEHVSPRYTFAGMGIYQPAMFANLSVTSLRLATLFDEYCARRLISGEYHRGCWFDIGTPERLMQLRDYIGATGLGLPDSSIAT
jgi:N-acetyl-alpha-D-muramate 1-phosphate uridylyltransferase